MDSGKTNLVLVGYNNIIDKFGNSTVIGGKFGAKMTKSKSKNKIKPFLAKSKLYTQSSGSGYFTTKARLAFKKLR